jgi:predicted kinase
MLDADDLVVLLTFASAILFVGTITFAALWVRAREKLLRQRGDARVGDPSDRLEHLVTAVDTIAIEVERISEAQRFTTQVLAQRLVDPLEPRRVASPERVITPH